MSEGERVFSDGPQLGRWRGSNCDWCAKYNRDRFDGRCEIDEAIGLAYSGDGRFTEEMRRRMGYEGHERDYVWDCPELEYGP